MNESSLAIDQQYHPEHSVDIISLPVLYQHTHFVDHMEKIFGVTDKLDRPLKDLLSIYGIESKNIMGSNYKCVDTSAGLHRFEKAKLIVLTRMMSKQNKKWRSTIKHAKATMSAGPGSRAPTSPAHTQTEELLRLYISSLKGGIPAAQLNSAQPLLRQTPGYVCDGGNFQISLSLMSKFTTEFIAAHQRQLLVDANKEFDRFDPVNGYNFWPPEVSPDFGITKAVNAAKGVFLEILETTSSNADEDMARVRLMKDFFLDSEVSFWSENYEVNSLVAADLPVELENLELNIEQREIREKVAKAFGVDPMKLPEGLEAQAKCFIWLYVLKHCALGEDRPHDERIRHFKKFQLPHYIAIAAMILYSLKLSSKKVEIRVPGETCTKVLVYKSFQKALSRAQVNLQIAVEENEKKLEEVIGEIDTKVIFYMTTLFSISTNADDGQSKFLRMEYAREHAKVRGVRTKLLSELSMLLKPYSCQTAYELICLYASIMRDNTLNPLI